MYLIHLGKITLSACVDINCILNIFNEYPFITTIFTSIFTSAVSIYLGWFLHRRKIDADAIEEHFKDLKNFVVRPISEIYFRDESVYSSSKSGLPKAEDITKKRRVFSSTTKGKDNDMMINETLFNDFISNHYPQIKELWDKTNKERTDADKQYEILKDVLKQQLKEGLSNQGINDSIVDFGWLHSELIEWIRGEKVDNDRLYVVEDKIILNVTLENSSRKLLTINKSSHPPQTHEDLEKITENILTVFRSIYSNKDIQAEINKFNALKNDESMHYKQLQNNMKILPYKKNLRFKKRIGFWTVKCEFVKTNL